MSTAAMNSQDATKEVRALEAEFERHANAHDAAALTDAFYAEGAQLLAPNIAPVIGKPAIRQFWDTFLAAGSTDIRLETGEVLTSGDLAYGVGQYGHTVSGVRHIGKYVVVYRRQDDGRYKAVVDAFSDNA